jgi:hypothetical protein
MTAQNRVIGRAGWAVSVVVALLAVTGSALADGNIDLANKHAWAENAGWHNWRPTYGGVTVVTNGANSYLTGYAWAENIGWVRLGDGTGPYANNSATDWGVNMDAGGKLSGYAWAENVGWISFSNAYAQVTINTTTGSFDSYAWAENIGWIHFKNAAPAYNVRTTVFDVLPSVWSGSGFKFK